MKGKWDIKRREPYTEKGITVKKCIRCGSKAKFQWQICSDNNYYRPLCLGCDIELNKTVLLFMGHPNTKGLIAIYSKEKREETVTYIKENKKKKPKKNCHGAKIKRGVRVSVFEKTGGLCIYCNTNLQIDRPGAEDYMTADHVIPIIKGGSSHITNLVPSCQPCNVEKDDMDLDVFLKSRKKMAESKW